MKKSQMFGALADCFPTNSTCISYSNSLNLLTWELKAENCTYLIVQQYHEKIY